MRFAAELAAGAEDELLGWDVDGVRSLRIHRCVGGAQALFLRHLHSAVHNRAWQVESANTESD